jgi:cell division protein FtsL
MHDHSLSHLSSIRLRKTRLIKRLGVSSIVFLVAAFCMIYVWQRVQVIKVGYEIEALKKERAELTRENNDLQIEKSTLTSPERIESLADTDIGMHVPVSGQIVMVKKIKRSTASASAGGREVNVKSAAPGKT